MKRTLLAVMLVGLMLAVSAFAVIAASSEDASQTQNQGMMGYGQGMMGNGQGMMGNGQGMMGNGQGMMGYGRGMMGNGRGMMGYGQGMMGYGQGMMGYGQGMMGNGQGMMGYGQGMMGYGQGMMGYGRHMLDQRLTHDLFLDRVDALGLTPEQVTKLRAIRTECRKDVIHAAAEARIARLNLEDLLNNDRWTPKEAEKLVRQQYKLQGDIELRYLQAVYSARQELTAEQLEKVHP